MLPLRSQTELKCQSALFPFAFLPFSHYLYFTLHPISLLSPKTLHFPSSGCQLHHNFPFVGFANTPQTPRAEHSRDHRFVLGAAPVFCGHVTPKPKYSASWSATPPQPGNKRTSNANVDHQTGTWQSRGHAHVYTCYCAMCLEGWYRAALGRSGEQARVF